MIALNVVPLTWADPDSRKLIIPDPNRTGYECRGEENAGWYSVMAATAWFMLHGQGGYIPRRTSLEPCVVVSEGDTLATVVGSDEHLTGLFVSHFSAPTDADDFFVDTPLLTVPEVEAAPGHTSLAVRLRGGV